MRNFEIIAAVNKNNGIGNNGCIQWKCKSDLKYFRNITIDCPENFHNICIVGYKTAQTIPFLKNSKRNMIIVNTLEEFNQVLINACNKIIHKIFVIGGEKIYNMAISHPKCVGIHLSIIDDISSCDKFFPTIGEKYKMIVETDKNDFIYKYFNRINSDEQQYINLIDNIMNRGILKSDRTGTGTKSLFGNMLRFSLVNNTLPLLTCKYISFKTIVTELLWFLQGRTDNKWLKDRNVHIWDRDCSKTTLISRGLKLEEDDIGPGYGFQWRHFGAEYVNCKTDYTDQGIDQIKYILNLLKNNPDSRRMILTAWNPETLDKMCLPPCHFTAQFEVHNNLLSCMLIQRSGDVGLGVPFNIASYAILTHLFAQMTGLTAYELVHVIGDAHIYNNHDLSELIKLEPFSFPTLKINIKNNVDDYIVEDFELFDYISHKKIKLDLNV